jgi:hypothetical protein
MRVSSRSSRRWHSGRPKGDDISAAPGLPTGPRLRESPACSVPYPGAARKDHAADERRERPHRPDARAEAAAEDAAALRPGRRGRHGGLRSGGAQPRRTLRTARTSAPWGRRRTFAGPALRPQLSVPERAAPKRRFHVRLGRRRYHHGDLVACGVAGASHRLAAGVAGRQHVRRTGRDGAEHGGDGAATAVGAGGLVEGRR